MEIRLRPAAYAEQATRSVWGDTSSTEALAELIRVEVTARQHIARWTVVRRIAQAASAEPSDVEAVCRLLEAEGDFNVTRGGVLHVTPVRLVSCKTDEFRVITSLPTARLEAKLPGTIRAQGARRILQAAADALKKPVAKVSGLLLTPSEWAGLELVPPANKAWLDAVDERLQWLPEAAGSLERDGALDWRGLTLTEKGPRYHRGAEGARLWRAKSALGRWLFAWTAAGASPASGDFVSLTVDDATRTTFAMARAAEQPVVATLVRSSPDSTIVLDTWLPRAEYRYLAMIATPSGENHKNTWSIPSSRIDDVVATLAGRLGLDITEEAGG